MDKFDDDAGGLPPKEDSSDSHLADISGILSESSIRGHLRVSNDIRVSSARGAPPHRQVAGYVGINTWVSQRE